MDRPPATNADRLLPTRIHPLSHALSVHAMRMIRNIVREEINERFAPEKRLVLITDERGNSQEGWSVWASLLLAFVKKFWKPVNPGP